MLEDHLKNVQDELGTTQVEKFIKKKKQNFIVFNYYRDFVMHVKMKLKQKII